MAALAGVDVESFTGGISLCRGRQHRSRSCRVRARFVGSNQSEPQCWLGFDAMHEAVRNDEKQRRTETPGFGAGFQKRRWSRKGSFVGPFPSQSPS